MLLTANVGHNVLDRCWIHPVTEYATCRVNVYYYLASDRISPALTAGSACSVWPRASRKFFVRSCGRRAAVVVCCCHSPSSAPVSQSPTSSTQLAFHAKRSLCTHILQSARARPSCRALLHTHTHMAACLYRTETFTSRPDPRARVFRCARKILYSSYSPLPDGQLSVDAHPPCSCSVPAVYLHLFAV